MEFIASTWYLWLIITLLGYGLAFANQLKRMKGIATGEVLDQEVKDFVAGVGFMMFAAAIGSLGGVLLLLSVILNVIDYAK